MKNKIFSISIILVILISSITFAYSDVPLDNIYYYSISKLKEYGILVDGDKFNPDDYITKAEVADIVYKAIEYTKNEEIEKLNLIASKINSNIGIYVMLEDLSSSDGSGVAISEHLILTAYHVVEYAFLNTCNLTISGYNEKQVGVVVFADESNDLALIETEATLDYVEISKQNPMLLEECYVIGNPIIFENLLSAVRVSNLDTELDGYSDNVVSVDGNFNSGNSGGMVLNKDGKLVGIVQAKLRDDLGEGIGFITKLDTIKTFLNNYNER